MWVRKKNRHTPPVLSSFLPRRNTKAQQHCYYYPTQGSNSSSIIKQRITYMWVSYAYLKFDGDEDTSFVSVCFQGDEKPSRPAPVSRSGAVRFYCKPVCDCSLLNSATTTTTTSTGVFGELLRRELWQSFQRAAGWVVAVRCTQSVHKILASAIANRVFNSWEHGEVKRAYDIKWEL